jgi:MFS family permease
MLAVGTFLVVFGMMMTSIATEYWQVFLAQGLCTGLGTSCIFLPSVAIVATYFSTKRALAMGIVAAGGSIGSVIYPIVFHRLQPQIGFGWATRVIGFLALFGLAISLVIMKTRLPPVKKSRSLVDTAAFRSPVFVLFCFGVFFVFVGLYIPFYYIIDYAQYKVGVSEDLSFYFLCVINAASAFGRIIPGLLADRLGSLEVITICTLATTVLAYVWIAIDNLGAIIVFCILYGFFSGAVVSLPPTVVASLAPELELVGTWVGMCFGFAGLGFLIGNPIAGTLISIEDRQFTHGIIFAASMVAAAAVFFVSVELIRLGFISVRSSKRRLAEPQ